MVLLPSILFLPTEMVGIIFSYLKDGEIVEVVRCFPLIFASFVGRAVTDLVYTGLLVRKSLSISKLLTIFPNLCNLNADRSISATMDDFTRVIARKPERLFLNVDLDPENVGQMVDPISDLPHLIRFGISLKAFSANHQELLICDEWLQIPMTKDAYNHYVKLRKFCTKGVIVTNFPRENSNEIMDAFVSIPNDKLRKFCFNGEPLTKYDHENSKKIMDAFVSIYSSPIEDIGFTMGINPVTFAQALNINARSSRSIKRIVLKTFCYPPPSSEWLRYLERPIESITDMGKCAISPYDIDCVIRFLPNVKVIPVSEKVTNHHPTQTQETWTWDINMMIRRCNYLRFELI